MLDGAQSACKRICVEVEAGLLRWSCFGVNQGFVAHDRGAEQVSERSRGIEALARLDLVALGRTDVGGLHEALDAVGPASIPFWVASFGRRGGLGRRSTGRVDLSSVDEAHPDAPPLGWSGCLGSTSA